MATRVLLTKRGKKMFIEAPGIRPGDPRIREEVVDLADAYDVGRRVMTRFEEAGYEDVEPDFERDIVRMLRRARRRWLRKGDAKKDATKKSAAKKGATKKGAAKKGAAKKGATKKGAAKKGASKRTEPWWKFW